MAVFHIDHMRVSDGFVKPQRSGIFGGGSKNEMRLKECKDKQRRGDRQECWRRVIPVSV